MVALPKISIKNLVKRSCALLSALCIALYSLITAPLFGVHAVDIKDTVLKVIGWVEEEVKPVVNALFSDNPESALQILTADALLSVGLPIAYNGHQAVLNAFGYNVPYPVSVTPSTSIGCSGYTYMNGEYKVSTIQTYDPFTVTFDPQSNEFPVKFFLMSLGDYGVYMLIDPYTSGETNFIEDDTLTFTWENVRQSTSSGYDEIFRLKLKFLNDSRSLVTRRCVLYLCFIPLSGGSPLYVSQNVSFSETYIFNGRCATFTPQITINDPVSYFANFFSYQKVIMGRKGTTTDDNIVKIAPNSSISYPVNPNYITLNDENIYNYYVNTNYPTVTTTYPIVNVIQPPQDYIVPSPTDPTEPNTGGGGVVIIDPFTLPPEWLEDNAELGTSHYELDSDQWEDPLEIIKKYKHASITGELPSGQITDDGSFEGPADVVEAMEAFTDFAYMILTESGLLWVVASLVSVGLVVRLFTLK